jgi:hypothetical protein
MSRTEAIRSKRPELFGKLRFFTAENGGPQLRKTLGWGCPAFVRLDQHKPPGWDCHPKFSEIGLGAGEEAEIGFVFLSGEKAARCFIEAGQMFLWEGRFIGEVTELRLP